MADEVIRRSGSAADHGSFTGANGEWTHDTTLKAIRVHDGSQAGGFPIFHEGYVESAPDGGTDAYSADARRPVSAGETVRADFTSANTTTTPTFENTQGTPSGALTITTRDGSALWAGALSGVHELQLASGGGSWLVLDPNPIDEDDMASDSDAAVPTQQSAKAYVDNLYEIKESGSVSAASSLDITDLESGFDYEIVISNLVPATDSTALHMRTDTNNGASFDSGASDYQYSETRLQDSAGTGGGGSSAASNDEIVLHNAVGNASDNEQLALTINVINPMDSASQTRIHGTGGGVNSAGEPEAFLFYGGRNAEEANNAVQLFMSSGNISLDYTVRKIARS